MTQSPPAAPPGKTLPHGAKNPAEKERLAKALRKNLLRRKASADGRKKD